MKSATWLKEPRKEPDSKDGAKKPEKISATGKTFPITRTELLRPTISEYLT